MNDSLIVALIEAFERLANEPQCRVVVLRGAGAAAFNKYGFSSGYYQTGASSWALQNRWEPGQWMSITCTELGLSGLYRVEQVDWSLEPGAFMQVITITFNRKNYNTLSAQVARGK
jgi:hypothetical protein